MRPAPRVRQVASQRPEISGLVYAIGDVHGRKDLFDALLQIIQHDAQAIGAEGGRPTLVLLGDLVDRGPESAACVERAIALQSEGWCEVVALKGNHEEALLLFLNDTDIGPQWMQHGGGPTLQSYGLNLASSGLATGWPGIQTAFRAALPAQHHAFLNAMRLSYVQGDYVFVHAGVRPGVRLEDQSEEDLLWIREAFLNVSEPYPGKVVVHGHTPTAAPELKRSRIGIDTGAYASGILTAVRLRGFERTILQAR